jgi:Fur family ferric uptake transcriptional regulator
MTDDATQDAGVTAVLDLVRARGGRVTAPRRALVASLFAVEGHATAEELVDRVRATDPAAHLSTIYRNLEDLEALGVVSHSHLGHGAATYQLVAHAHAHFLCTACGSTLDAAPEVFRDVATRVREATGFEIEPSHFAVEGLCRSCAARARD